MGLDRAAIDPGLHRHAIEFTWISYLLSGKPGLFTHPLARRGVPYLLIRGADRLPASVGGIRQRVDFAYRSDWEASQLPYGFSVRLRNDVPVQVLLTARKAVAMNISASEARQRLFPLLQQVNTDHQPVRITSKAGDAVLMSADDYDSWQETVYLLRSPENARRLMEAVARDKSGQAGSTKSLDELREMAGGEE